MSRTPDAPDAPIEIKSETTEGGEVEPSRSGPTSASQGSSSQTNPDQVAELQLYQSELAGERDQARVARLTYEIGHLHETGQRDLDAATASYQQALSADAGFLATFWSLRRLYSEAKRWDRLVQLFDTEIGSGRFAPRDLADLWVERGRVLEDRLQRQADGMASYRSALALLPDHAPALLALLIAAARVGDRDGIEVGLAGLAAAANSPMRRAALGAELARVQREAASPSSEARSSVAALAAEDTGHRRERLERALQTLRSTFASIAQQPVDGATPDGPSLSPAGPVLHELERLTRVSEFPSIQIQALDEMVSQLPAEESRLAAALLREKAHLLRNELGDAEGAWKALDEALPHAPSHPLVLLEMMDIAEELRRDDLVGEVISRCRFAVTTTPPPSTAAAGARQAILLRHLEILARGDRALEAVQLLNDHSELSADDPTVFALGAVLRAKAGDAAGLAALCEGEGRRLSDSDAAGSAHALVRAASIRDHLLDDGAGAETLYRQALTAAPGYRPAIDALEARLRSGGRWKDLAELLAGELAAMTSSRHPPKERAARDESQGRRRRAYLLESLVAVHRDGLHDPPAALRYQQQLCTLHPDEVRQWVRLYDLQVMRGALEGPEGESMGAEGIQTLRELASRADHPAVEAALAVEIARLAAGIPQRTAAGAENRALAETVLRQALAHDPTGLGAQALDGVLAEGPAALDSRMEGIAVEIAAAERQSRSEVARALRFRAAFHAAAGTRWAAAIESLRPLREANDALAIAWSVDLAQRSGDAALEAVAIQEAQDKLPPAAYVGGQADLGEALERTGDASAAQAAFTATMGAAPSMDAAVGLLRLACGAGGPGAAALALQEIARLSQGEVDSTLARAVWREARALAVAQGETTAEVASRSGPPEETESGGGGAAPPVHRADAEDALLTWIEAVRAGDPLGAARGLLDLCARLAPASATEGPVPREAVPVVLPLLLRAAARARLAGPAASEAIHARLWQAGSDNPVVDAALSDLPPASGPPHPWPSERPDRRGARAARAGGALALALDLERARDAEVKGRLGEALEAYGRVLARDPDRLEAMEGVRRLARTGGDRLGEARALARVGALLKTPAHAGRVFAEAARLYDELGRPEEAMALCWKVLEQLPDDAPTVARLRALLLSRPGAPGHPEGYEMLLGHQLSRTAAADGATRIRLLCERAHNRLARLRAPERAIEDWKRVLKIDERHESTLRQLATLAIKMENHAQAAWFLERFLKVVRDEDRAAQARLELAQAHEAAHDAGRAVAALREAAQARPRDTVPLQRLTELHLRQGDWRGAVETLRSWESLVSDSRAKAELECRIGALLRDRGGDYTGAALSFGAASELDPLAEGIWQLVALYEGAGDASGRARAMERAISDMRRALEADPLDMQRLSRMKELLARADPNLEVRDAAAVVSQLLGLLGDGDAGPSPGAAWPAPARPALPREVGANAFWARLAHPGARGFMTEIWPHLVMAAAQLFPVNAAKLGANRANRVTVETERRLAWIATLASAAGLRDIGLYLTNEEGERVVALEVPERALVLSRGVLAGDGVARFQVARAIALLRGRVTVLEQMSSQEVGGIFAAAALVAGAAAPAAMARSRSLESNARALEKAMSRKERKALALQTSRFGSESFHPEVWRNGMLRTADRFGLLISGDLAASVRALEGIDARHPSRAASMAASGAPPGGDEIRRHPAMLELVRFAMSEDYLVLRREAGLTSG